MVMMSDFETEIMGSNPTWGIFLLYQFVCAMVNIMLILFRNFLLFIHVKIVLKVTLNKKFCLCLSKN